MKSFNALFILAIAFTSSQTLATDSAQHGSKAVKHSALAATHGIASTAQVASATAAIPLIVAGSAGVASTAAGTQLLDNASHVKASKSKKLTITEITITADPSPQMVMKTENKDDK